MSPTDADILHVSDTALMVAACRAMETARPDGLVRDPFAEQLAGARGMAIARGLPRLEIMCFGVGIRSRFLDELVMDAITVRKVSTVLSLGSGLDSRPWRLELPEGVRWIEVDFPAMLDYKAAIMAQHQPKCRIKRIAADLNDESERRAMFAGAGGTPALMITEGLLMYLPAETVEALAVEPTQMAGVRYWLMDLTSPDFARRAQIDLLESIQKVRSPNHADGAQIFDILNRNGWTSVRRRNYTTDALEAAMERIRALAQGLAASTPMPPPAPDDPSGVYLLGRA